MTRSSSDLCFQTLNEWAEGRGALPTFYSAAAAKSCFIMMARQYQQTTAVVQAPTVTREDVLRLFEMQERINSLMEWAAFMDPDDERLTVLNAAWERRVEKIIMELATGPFPSHLKTLIAQESLAPVQAAMIYSLRDLEARRRGQNEEKVVQDRHLARLRREERAFPQGVGFTLEELAELPAYLRRSIEAETERGGWEPNWLPKGHDDLATIAGFLSDEKAREVTWVQSQPNTSQPEEIKALLVSRRKQCRRGTSFAEEALSEHAEPHPVFVQHVLHATLRNLAPAQKLRMAAFQQAANRNHGGINVTRPWNTQVVSNAAYAAVSESFPERNDLFPVFPTLNKAVPDILRAIGWSCELSKETLPGVSGFDCARPDGAQVRLWVRPFTRSSDRFEDYGGIFTSMGQTWSGRQEKMTCAIDLYMSGEASGFDPVKLVHLAHELGHMVHYMSMPKEGVLGEMLFPADLVEFPSQLLERYVTPERLAAWVRPTAIAHYRTPGYWRNIEPKATQLQALDVALSETVLASLDLNMHLPGARSINACHNQLRALAGLPPADPRTSEHRAAFMWKSDYAARDYIYLWGKLLIEQVLPLGSSSATVARCYRQFIDQIGSQAVLPKDVRRCWKAWQGETLRQSVTQGSKKWAQRLTEQNEAVLAANPVLREPSPRRPRMGR